MSGWNWTIVIWRVYGYWICLPWLENLLPQHSNTRRFTTLHIPFSDSQLDILFVYFYLLFAVHWIRLSIFCALPIFIARIKKFIDVSGLSSLPIIQSLAVSEHVLMMKDLHSVQSSLVLNFERKCFIISLMHHFHTSYVTNWFVF